MSAEMLAAGCEVNSFDTETVLHCLMLFKKGKGLCLPPRLEMELSSETGKKALYIIYNSLKGLKESKWQGNIGSGTSPKGSLVQTSH